MDRSRSISAQTLSGRILSLLLFVAVAVPAFGQGFNADASKPKLGPFATPIERSHDYFRNHEAPDYWALSPYYMSQMTNSACSLATVATAINALRGLPAYASESLVTQASLLEKVAIPDWARKTAEHGEGVTWADFNTYLAISLKAFGLETDIETFKPADAAPGTLAQLRHLLADNERSDTDIALVYYNQGVVTGDYDGPHVSPIGVYDAEGHRVLIMDVDREWYGPYWTSEEKLLEAMLRPTPPNFGVLAGETGGIVRVTIRKGRVN